LCQNVLPDNGNVEEAEDIYPVIPLAYERHILIRILAFISVVAIVISYVVYKYFHQCKLARFCLAGLGKRLAEPCLYTAQKA